MELLNAVFLGFIFGFILQKSGAANPERIIGMLRLRDLHLMKAIFLGIGISSLGLFAMMAAGIIDPGHLSVKSSYVGVVVGGVLLGAGWAISGFCPGTGVVAVGSGRKDAMIFILGGLVGAIIFTLSYASLKGTFLFNKLGGKVTLVATGNEKYASLFPSVSALAVASVIAVVFMAIAIVLPGKKN